MKLFIVIAIMFFGVGWTDYTLVCVATWLTLLWILTHLYERKSL